MAERLVQCRHLGLHQSAGVAGQQVRNTFGAGVRAVCRGERIVDVEIGQFGEFRRERRIVGLLALVEARVFQHHDVAVAQRGDGGLRDRSDTILGEGDGAAEHLGHGGGDRAQRHARHDLAFRPVEVAAHDHPRALAGQFGDRRQHALDARQVGDAPVAHRHVQIDAQQNPFARNREAIQRTDRHG
jgi:hypothetical protein